MMALLWEKDFGAISGVPILLPAPLVLAIAVSDALLGEEAI